MKNYNKILFFFSILFFISSCSEKIILPQYVTVDKINSLSNGMTKKKVENTMKIAPFDAYHGLQNGCELYSYKYVLNDQKIDPEDKNKKDGLNGNIEHYTQPKNVYVYFENNLLTNVITDLGLKYNNDLDDFGNLLEASCSGPVSGCTDESALNFNEAATQDDGSCEFCPCDFMKNPNYDPVRNCGDQCIPINDSKNDSKNDGSTGNSDDDCSICDLVKNAGANTTINVSTTAPWSNNSSAQSNRNESIAKTKKTSSNKKLDKLNSALEKSKAKDAKKGKTSKKTKMLQKAIDKLSNK